MNITPTQKPGWLELRLEGRLDAAWSEHLYNTVAANVREGRHDIRLDTSALEYLRSAGIRAILRANREVTGVGGSFAIIRASDFVVETLSMAGFSSLLALETVSETNVPSEIAVAVGEYGVGKWDKAGMTFETYEMEPDAALDVSCVGKWSPWSVVGQADCRRIALGRDVVAIGIGAPGEDLASARAIMGDFVSAAGCTAWLPTNGSSSPDYLLQEERFVPEIAALSALRAVGGFSQLLRFQPRNPGAILPMTGLMEAALDASKSTAAAFVALAEVEGLVGVATTRSPCLATAEDKPASFPQVQDWMTFCGERVHSGAMAMIVGFVDATKDGRDLPGLTPLPSHEGWKAHAHAVVFPFKALPNGKIFMSDSVTKLFEGAEPTALLHLVEDHRPALGLGQSSLRRGAVWCAPAHFISEGK